MTALDDLFEMPADDCPACGYHITGASSPRPGPAPTPQDYTMCLNCGTILGFTTRLTLRRLDDGEFATMDQGLLRDLGRMRRAHRLLKPAMGDLRECR